MGISSHEYKILRYVQDHDFISYVDLLNALHPGIPFTETSDLIRHLGDCRFIALSKPYPHMDESRISITPGGTAAITTYKQERRRFILNVTIGLLTLATTTLFGILGLLLALRG